MARQQHRYRASSQERRRLPEWIPIGDAAHNRWSLYVRTNHMERTQDSGGRPRLVFSWNSAGSEQEELKLQPADAGVPIDANSTNDGRTAVAAARRQRLGRGSLARRTARKRAVVRQPRWAGLWEGSLATAFTSCRKLRAAPSMTPWQQPCAPKPWAHYFRSGPLDCSFLGTDYGGFYLPNRMCFLNEFEPSRPPVAYGFGIGSDISYDLTLASAYPSLKVRMFDPTPYALGHAAAVLETVATRTPSCRDASGRMQISKAACEGEYFRRIAESNIKPSQLSVHPWAIGVTDGVLQFRKTDTGSLFTDPETSPPPPAKSWWAGRRLQGQLGRLGQQGLQGQGQQGDGQQRGSSHGRSGRQYHSSSSSLSSLSSSSSSRRLSSSSRSSYRGSDG